MATQRDKDRAKKSLMFMDSADKFLGIPKEQQAIDMIQGQTTARMVRQAVANSLRKRHKPGMQP